MGKPEPPTPPDPAETSAAQTGTNVATSIANANLQNVDQSNPYGSLSYEQSGSYEWTDPETGQTFNVPQFSANTEYSPELQGIYDSTLQAQQSLANTANERVDYLGNYLQNNPVKASSLSGWGQTPGTQQIVQYDSNRYGAPDRTLGNEPALQTGYDQFGQIQTQGGQVGARTDAPNAPNLNTNVQDARALQYGDVTGGSINRTGGDTSGIQSSGPQSGQLATNIAGAGDISRQNIYQNNLQNSVQQANYDRTGPQAGDLARQVGTEDLTRSYGTDFTENRDEVEAAMMQRLNQQVDRDREALRTRLANQGITPGSEAYNQAMDSMERQIADSRTGILLAAGQEQSRLAGLERDRSMFENTAAGQAFGQGLQAAGFQNQAQGQAFGQDLQTRQFRNSAEQQAFADRMAGADLNNAASQMRYNQMAQDRQAVNAAQAQQFGQNAQQAQFQNEALGQRFGEDLASRGFQNEAQAQQFGQQLNNAQFANQAQQQAFGQAATNRDIYNQTAGQEFQQNLAGFDAENAALSQGFANAMQGANFENQGLQQMYQQTLGNQQFANEAQQQGTAQNAQQAQFLNAALQGQYGLEMQRFAQENAAQQQAFNQEAQRVRDQTTNRNIFYQQQLSSAQQANARRSQDLQEQVALRNQPINEITSLMGQSQVSAPQFQVNQPSAMPTTDYAALVNQNYNQQMQNYNTESQLSGNILGALGSFGSLFI